MFHCWQNYSINFWEKLMYVSYTTDRSGVSAGHLAGALAIICLWVLWHDWLKLRGCSVKMTLLLESSTHPMCMPIPICRIGQFNSCMLMVISDRYIMKRHVSHAWYGCWTIKVLVEAKVLYDGFTVSCRGIAAPLIIARPLQCLYIYRNSRTSKNPILKATILYWHWLCMYIMCG